VRGTRKQEARLGAEDGKEDFAKGPPGRGWKLLKEKKIQIEKRELVGVRRKKFMQEKPGRNMKEKTYWGKGAVKTGTRAKSMGMSQGGRGGEV